MTSAVLRAQLRRLGITRTNLWRVRARVTFALSRFLPPDASDEAPRLDIPAPPPDAYSGLTLLPAPVPAELDDLLARPPLTEGRHRPDVICLSIIDWEFRFQRPQQVMSQFAAHGHRVFYVSVSRFRPDGAQPRVSVLTIAPNVFEVRLSVDHPLQVYSEVVGDRNLAALVEALADLRRLCDVAEAVVYVMISSWTPVALEARARWQWRVVYDCMDEWENFPGIDPTLVRAEVTLARDADLLVVSAQRLLEKWQQAGRTGVLARNAADYDFYAERCRPNDLLAGTSHPIIGYYGAIADWFDVALVERAARERPHYSFVLIGGVFDVDVTALEALPNVRLLGQRPYEQMPQFLHGFDVAIIPFKVNSITEATDPVKLYEYLAGGKPVVSTALPEVASRPAPVLVARDAGDFVRLLDVALAETDPALPDRRRQFASGETWAARYRQIDDGLRAVVPLATIVIVTYNNLALTRLCLDSIVRNTDYPNYEIVVVDNASADGTPAYLRALAAASPHLTVIHNDTNTGFAAANNQGVLRGIGDHVVLLNNDTVVPPGWLSRLLRHLRDPAIGLVGPMTNFVGNEAFVQAEYGTLAEMEAFARARARSHADRLADIHMLAMFCVAMTRRTFDRVGPLDEGFGAGMFEDDDYAHRMRAAGLRVVCAGDAFVHHVGQAAFKSLIATAQYDALFEKNRARFEAKWRVTWTPHQWRQLF